VSGSLPCLLVLAALAAPSGNAIAAPIKQNPSAKKTEAASAASHERKTAPKAEAKKTEPKANAKQAEAKKVKRAEHVAEKRKKASDAEKSAEKSAPELTGDLAVVRDAMALARKGKTADAIDAEKTISDPAGQKLVEWFILRHPDAQATFDRYATFIAGNPDWPGCAGAPKRCCGTTRSTRRPCTPSPPISP
jgi:soluble lytic murein transglycosylase